MKTNQPQVLDNIPIPNTDFTGVVKIGKTQIPCAVLYPDSDNPVRVFVQREVVGLLTGNKKGGFDRYLKPANLQPYIPEQFKNKLLSESTIQFKFNGRIAQGFRADDLIDLCQMYMQACTDKALLENQKHLAVQSEIIVFAFAKTGVTAVIDDVTGYGEVRERFALERILNKYVDIEARKWVKRFPDKFYQLIFKLNNWEWSEKAMNKKPQVIGRWTNQIIYERFPKGTLGKLKDVSPLNEHGHRIRKLHQHLTDIGNEDLKEYISNAMFLMEAAPNWRRFMGMLARALGKTYQGEMFE